ncbi:MAG: RDD family protein [Neisseria sp.]
MPNPIPTASLKRRFASLMYEGLLTSAVTAIAGVIAGMIAVILNQTGLTAFSSPIVSVLLLAAWWFYFKANWNKKGQTLPMQVWKIGLANAKGNRPPLPQLRLRFMWACVFLVFIPILAYAGLQHNDIPPKAAAGAALLWWILPWGFAFFNRDRQFLYDYLAGTRLIDLKK